MAEKQDDGTSTVGQDQASRGPEAAAERRKEGGQSDEGTDASILTPGGNVRYGGGNAQGVPMVPDSEDDK
jgi:hypothetical protein